jgi:hypothetical protein
MRAQKAMFNAILVLHQADSSIEDDEVYLTTEVVLYFV